LAFGVAVEYQPEKDKQDKFTETLEYRLFRRHRSVSYQGRLHPQFTPSLSEVASQLGMTLLPAPIRLRNHAYASELTEPKLRWAVRLLERELQDRPGQLGYLIEYGRTLLRLNDPKGHAVLAQAEGQIWPVKNAPQPPAPEVQYLLEYLLTVSSKQSQCRLTSSEVVDLAVRWFPFSPPLLWVLAAHCFKAGQFGQAANLLERLITMGKTESYDRFAAFDPRIIGEDAVMNLGTCYWRLNDLPRAEACFRQLLTSPIHRANASQNLIMVKGAQHQEDSAFYSSYLGGINPERPDY
jgi:tetratricopeptide (TPR) repeat protein